MRVAVVAVEGVGGLELGIERVLVGGIAAAVVEEDGCGLVGGEACVRGAHGSLATAAAAAFARLQRGRFALSLACFLALSFACLLAFSLARSLGYQACAG